MIRLITNTIFENHQLELYCTMYIINTHVKTVLMLVFFEKIVAMPNYLQCLGLEAFIRGATNRCLVCSKKVPQPNYFC